MKPLSELTKEDIKDIKVVCFDVDGVTIKRGTEIEEKGTELKVKTSPLEEDILKKLIQLKKYYHITVNSGRSSLYLTKVFYGMLWGEASVIAENGILVVYKGRIHQTETFSDQELEIMKKITLDFQNLAQRNNEVRGFEPKQFLITLHCWKDIPEVYDIVKKNDKDGVFYCWWNGEAYDVCPKRLNKGQGLKNLSQILGYSIKQTMAIGNGINDKDMTDVAGVGVTTDKESLKSDYYIEGEHLGGRYLIDKLLELNK